MMCNFFSFFSCCTEKKSFRFDPAYPGPDDSASFDAARDAWKYLNPEKCIHICTCEGSKTAYNLPSPSPNLSLKSKLCEILNRFSYLGQGVSTF
jgi:hypothetical protein